MDYFYLLCKKIVNNDTVKSTIIDVIIIANLFANFIIFTLLSFTLLSFTLCPSLVAFLLYIIVLIHLQSQLALLLSYLLC